MIKIDIKWNRNFYFVYFYAMREGDFRDFDLLASNVFEADFWEDAILFSLVRVLIFSAVVLCLSLT